MFVKLNFLKGSHVTCSMRGYLFYVMLEGIAKTLFNILSFDHSLQAMGFIARQDTLNLVGAV